MSIANTLWNLWGGIKDMIPSFNPLLESIVKNIIQNQLGQYIDFKQFQLKSSKDVKMTKVNLKKEEINAKFLSTSPFLITYGQIGRMDIRIPLQDLLTKASCVEMSEIEIHLRPNLANISHESFQKYFLDLVKQANEAAILQSLSGSNASSDAAADYDADKMNELKKLLMHVLLNIKAQLNDIVVKIFFQDEPAVAATETTTTTESTAGTTTTTTTVADPHLMLRIQKVSKESDKSQSNSMQQAFLNGSSGISFERSVLAHHGKQQVPATGADSEENGSDNSSGIHEFFENHYNQQSKMNLEQSYVVDQNLSDVTFRIQGINLFLLHDSAPLSPTEFQHQGLKQHEQTTMDQLKFPFQYPHAKHPCNLMHIPEITTVLLYPLKRNSAKDVINISTEVESIEIMVEPYQLSILNRLIFVLENWKKQTDCLKLLRYTKDPHTQKLIVDTNDNYKAEHYNRSNRSNATKSKNENSSQLHFAAIHLQRQMNMKYEDNNSNVVDDILIESICQFSEQYKQAFKKKPSAKTTSKDTFFNASICVDPRNGMQNQQLQGMYQFQGNAQKNQQQQQQQLNMNLEQSAYLNQSQLDKIISHDFREISKSNSGGSSGTAPIMVSNASSQQQSFAQSQSYQAQSAQINQGSRAVAIRVKVKTSIVYLLKGSMRSYSDGNSSGERIVCEYSREWRILQSRKEKINRFVPCSHFQARINECNFMLSPVGAMDLNLDVKSIKVSDVNLVEPKYAHAQDSKQQKKDYQNQHSGMNWTFSRMDFLKGSEDWKNHAISSTFWRVDSKEKKSSVEVHGNSDKKGKDAGIAGASRVLARYEMSRWAHFCVNYLVVYHSIASARKKTEKPKVDYIRVHALRNTFGKSEKDTIMGQSCNSFQVHGNADEGAFEKSVKQWDAQGYAALKPNAALAAGSKEIPSGVANKEEVNHQKAKNANAAKEANHHHHHHHHHQKHGSHRQTTKNVPLLTISIIKSAKSSTQPQSSSQDSKQQSNNMTADVKQEIEEKQEVKLNLQRVYVGFGVNILHDITLILSPIGRWAEYAESLNRHTESRSVRVFEVPTEVRKVLKTIEIAEKAKHQSSVSVHIGQASVNILPYKFEQFFQVKERVANIYGNYAQWGCLCEVSDAAAMNPFMMDSYNMHGGNSNAGAQSAAAAAADKLARGSFAKEYLNLSIFEVNVMFVTHTEELKIEFAEADVWLAEHENFGAKKILRIARNYIPQSKESEKQSNQQDNGSNRSGKQEVHLFLVHPMIQMTKREKQSEANKASKLKQMKEKRNKTLKFDHLEKSVSQELSEKVPLLEDGLPADSYYTANEQEPDSTCVKSRISIGLPVLEVYLQHGDLEYVSDFVFSLKAMMDISDQFKSMSSKSVKFFTNVPVYFVDVNFMNILLDLSIAETNIYFNGSTSLSESSSSSAAQQQQQQQIPQIGNNNNNINNPSNRNIGNNNNNNNQNATINCLIFHLKNMGMELLLNKQLKKIKNQRDARFTLRLRLEIESILLLDNSLPAFITRSNNIQPEKSSNASSENHFPGNYSQFRVSSIYLPKLKPANVIIYKANLLPNNEDNEHAMPPYKLTRGFFGSQHVHMSVGNFIACQSSSSDRQIKFEMVMRRKEQWETIGNSKNILAHSKCPVGKSKEQIEIKALNLSHTVLIGAAAIASSQIILLAENGIAFQKQMMLSGGDLTPKNAFKEIIFTLEATTNVLTKFNIDYFITPSFAFFTAEYESANPQSYAASFASAEYDDLTGSISSSNLAATATAAATKAMSTTLLSPEMLAHLASLTTDNVDDRFMSPYRMLISIDSMALAKFQKREQFTWENEHVEAPTYSITPRLFCVDLKFDRISVDFLLTKEFNPSIDNFMFDCSSHASFDSLSNALGFSRIASIFDVQLSHSKQLNEQESTRVSVNSVHANLHSDAMHALTQFVKFASTHTELVVKSNSQRQSAMKRLDSMRDVQKAAETSIRTAICEFQLKEDRCEKIYHALYPVDPAKLMYKKHGNNSSLNSIQFFSMDQSSIYIPLDKKKQKQKQGKEEQKKQDNDRKKDDEMNVSFELIEGDNEFISVEEFTVESKLRFIVSTIQVNLFDGYVFDFTNVNSIPNYNEEFVKPSLAVQSGFQNAPNNNNNNNNQLRSGIRYVSVDVEIPGEGENMQQQQQQQEQQQQLQQLENIRMLDYCVIDQHAQLQDIGIEIQKTHSNGKGNVGQQQQQNPSSYSPASAGTAAVAPAAMTAIQFISREKAKKQVSVDSQMTIRIINAGLRLERFEQLAESDIKQHVELEVQEVCAFNKKLNYAQISSKSEQQISGKTFAVVALKKDPKDAAAVDNVSNNNKKKNSIDIGEVEVIEQLKEQPFLSVKFLVSEVSQIQRNVKFLTRTIRQANLEVHPVINVNLSSLDAEFFLRFLSKPKQVAQGGMMSSELGSISTPQQMKESFQRLIKRNSKLQDNFRLNIMKIKSASNSQQQQQPQQSENKQVQQQEEKEKSIRVETMTSVEFLYIPKISFLISNKKEGIDFSRLSKKEGLLQIINIGEIEGIELALDPITIEDKNVQALTQIVVSTWEKEVKKNLKWKIASQLPLVKNLLNIGHGVFDLVYMPLSYYQQGLSVIDGTYQGVKSFVINTTSESVNLSGALLTSIGSILFKNAKTASAAISSAKSYPQQQQQQQLQQQTQSQLPQQTPQPQQQQQAQSNKPQLTLQQPTQQQQHREIEIQTSPPKDEDGLGGSMDKFEYKAYIKPTEDKSQFATPASTAKKQNQQQQQHNHGAEPIESASVLRKQAPRPPCQECLANRPEQKLKLQQKEGQKLKAQNDKLIAQLREMSIQLDQTLEKFKMKKNDKQGIQESSQEVSQKQLENVKHQIEVYNKQLLTFANIDEEYSSKRMNQWYTQMREVDDQLEEARIMNKNLSYLNRESERTMNSNKKEIKLKILRDEIVLLKNLIRDARKTMKENEAGFKKTQDHTKKLEMRHEEVCKQFNVPFKPYESLPKEEKASLTIKETNTEKKQEVVYKITEESILKLKQDVKVLEECVKSIKKQMKIEQKNTGNKLRDLEEEKTSLTHTLAKKDKEINETYERLNGFRSLASNGSSVALGLKGSNFESSKPLKAGSLHMMTPYMKKYKETRRELKGHIALGGANAKSFDDALNHLPDTKDQIIVGITFWFAEDMIMGMETTYMLQGGQQEKVVSIDAGAKKDMMRTASLMLLGSEYITTIEGYSNFHCLEFLKFTTSRGNLLEVGSKKNIARCKQFSYEIRKNEIPVSFYGNLDICFNKKDERIKDYGKPEIREKFKDTPVLINFGVEIRKKDVYQEPLKSAAATVSVAPKIPREADSISVSSRLSEFQDKSALIAPKVKQLQAVEPVLSAAPTVAATTTAAPVKNTVVPTNGSAVTAPTAAQNLTGKDNTSTTNSTKPVESEKNPLPNAAAAVSAASTTIPQNGANTTAPANQTTQVPAQQTQSQPQPQATNGASTTKPTAQPQIDAQASVPKPQQINSTAPAVSTQQPASTQQNTTTNQPPKQPQQTQQGTPLPPSDSQQKPTNPTNSNPTVTNGAQQQQQQQQSTQAVQGKQ